MTNLGIFMWFILSLCFIITLLFFYFYYSVNNNEVKHNIEVIGIENFPNFYITNDNYFEKYRNIAGFSNDYKIYKNNNNNNDDWNKYLGVINIIGRYGDEFSIDFKNVKNIKNSENGKIVSFSLPNNKVYKILEINNDIKMSFIHGIYLILVFI